MENILHYFNEKIISLTENYLKSLIFEKGISGFTDDLIAEFARFGSDLTQYLVEYVEDEIFNLQERKEQFESLEKDSRSLVSIFGEIHYNRRYYKEYPFRDKEAYLVYTHKSQDGMSGKDEQPINLVLNKSIYLYL